MSEWRETNRAWWDERDPGERLFRMPDGLPSLPLMYSLLATAPA